jgi:hypothetical protein
LTVYVPELPFEGVTLALKKVGETLVLFWLIVVGMMMC